MLRCRSAFWSVAFGLCVGVGTLAACQGAAEDQTGTDQASPTDDASTTEQTAAGGDTTTSSTDLTEPGDTTSSGTDSGDGGTTSDSTDASAGSGPCVAPSDSRVDFGRARIGETVTRTITITNTGQVDGVGGEPLHIQAVYLNGQTLDSDPVTSGFFEVDPSALETLGPLPWTVAAGDSIAVPVRFRPLTEEAHSASLVFDSDNSPSCSGLWFNLEGTADDLRICGVATPALYFGDVPTGTTVTLPIDLLSFGDEPCGFGLSFNPLTVPEFAIERTPITGTGQAVIRFTPLIEREFKGEVVVSSNDPDLGDIPVQVFGRGIVHPPVQRLWIDLDIEERPSWPSDADLRIVVPRYTVDGGEGAATPCGRADPSPDWTSVAGRDLGRPELTVGANPFRVTHGGLPMDDGCFHLALDYASDCLAAPTVLQDIRTPWRWWSLDSILDLITLLEDQPGASCLAYESATTTVRASTNRVDRIARTVTLQNRGDTANVLTMLKRGREFQVFDYNPALCATP